MESTAGHLARPALSPSSPSPAPTSSRRRARALATAGALVLVAAGGLRALFPTAPARAAAPSVPVPAPPAGLSYLGVDEAGLASTLCALKQEVRWRTSAWSPATCQRIARAVLTSAAKHALSPALILGVMLNESDLDENVRTPYRKHGVVYATDSGLMGIRCVFDRRGRCGNGHVRGMRPRDVIDPVNNIALGAQELAYTRDRGGVERKTVAVKLPDGGRALARKLVRCRHRTHAYWAHYNHGSFYISRGFARHYGHRVGVLYYAFARTLGLPDQEVTAHPLTVRDPGARARTADRPVEARFRTLTQKIYRTRARQAPQDGPVATLASLEFRQ
jgi:hypothetical protein